MHVIGHQNEGVQRTTGSDQRLTQPLEITVVIILRKEARLAVMAALHNVQRYVGKVDAGAARHRDILSQARINEPGPFSRPRPKLARIR
jgi:hypothetical protein